MFGPKNRSDTNFPPVRMRYPNLDSLSVRKRRLEQQLPVARRENCPEVPFPGIRQEYLTLIVRREGYPWLLCLIVLRRNSDRKSVV